MRDAGRATRVWADVHVAGHDGSVVHHATLPLERERRVDGGTVFTVDAPLYQGLVATPGSVNPRPDARAVQYRVYAERDGRVVTDGLVHMCYLRSDAVSG